MEAAVNPVQSLTTTTAFDPLWLEKKKLLRDIIRSLFHAVVLITANVIYICFASFLYYTLKFQAVLLA